MTPSVPFHEVPETTFAYTKEAPLFHQQVRHIHFYAGNEKGEKDLPDYIRRYGQEPLEKADVIVALGGDGTMLDAMKMAYPFDIPVYGIDRGGEGYLLNSEPTDLISEIYHAAVVPFPALDCSGEDVKKRPFHQICLNDVATRCETSQTAHIRITLNDVVYRDEVWCNSVIVATPQGSTGYCRWADGMVIPVGCRQLSIAGVAQIKTKAPGINATVDEQTRIQIEALDTEKRPQSLDCDNVTEMHFKRCLIQKAPQTVRVLYNPTHQVVRHAIFAQRILSRA